MSADALKDIADYMGQRLGNAVKGVKLAYGELTVTVDAQHILEALAFLKGDIQCQFWALMDVSGVDYPKEEQRFAICYHLLSPRQNLRMRVRVWTDEDAPVPSCCSVYKGAEWYEREVYDLFGVCFSGHPDMRRILTDYGFQGHPLRKDFPVTGFVECRYDDSAKRVIYEPVLLRQEMREFDFLSPWEAPQYILPGDEKAKSDGGKAGK